MSLESIRHVRPGQTLLEMIIAIGVITVSTLGSVSLIVVTVTAGRLSQSRVEAANFAREGIEAIRAVRDTNYLRRDQNIADGAGCGAPDPSAGCPLTEWDDSGNSIDGYSPLSSGPTTYEVASFSPSGWLLATCTGCTGSANDFFQPQTYITERQTPATNPTRKYFIQSSACQLGGVCSRTKYSRVIAVTKVTSESTAVGNLEYLDVVATVEWNDRTGTKSLVAQERLYNWR